MIKLLRLIEAARTQGSIPLVTKTKEHGAGEILLPFSVLDHAMLHLRPIVFTPLSLSESEKRAVYLQEENVPKDRDGFPLLINAPFKTFSVEFSGDTAVSNGAPEEELQHSVECIVGMEQDPMRFITIQHVTFPNGTERVFATTGGFETVLQNIFEHLKPKTMGTINTRKRFRTLHGKGKHTIRQIIVVDPSKQNSLSFGAQNMEVDWTHRWEVRGHYRKIDGIGKDPSGNYCVDGFTYVQPHVKGPEDKPLIANKLRVIKGEGQ